MDTWKGRALGLILFESEMISQQDIDRALAEQQRTGLRFGEILVKLGIVSAEDVNWGLSKQLNVPFVRINPELIDGEAVRLVPEDIARRHHLVPYLIIDEELTVIIEDPTSKRALHDLEVLTGKHIIVAVGLAEEIAQALDLVYGKGGGAAMPAEDMRSEIFTPAQQQEMQSDFSGAIFLDFLFREALKRLAVSIQFEPKNEWVNLYFHFPGELVEAGKVSRAWSRIIFQSLKRRLQPARSKTGLLEGYVHHTVDDQILVFQAAFVDTPQGEAVTLTCIQGPHIPCSLCDLIIEPVDRQALEAVLAQRSGLVVMAGTERREKYSFLSLLLKFKNELKQKTILVGQFPWMSDEDYLHLRPAGGLPSDTLEAFDAALSQDPDILVLEDLMQVGLLPRALATALESKFILGLLRHPSTIAALEYMVEQISSRSLLSDALRALVNFASFRITRREFREPDPRLELAAKLLGLSPAPAAQATLMRNKADRQNVVVSDLNDFQTFVEIWSMDGQLADLLKTGEPFHKMIPALARLRGASLADQARELVLRGEISLDEFTAVLGSDVYASTR